jgi:hypothetical protein
MEFRSALFMTRLRSFSSTCSAYGSRGDFNISQICGISMETRGNQRVNCIQPECGFCTNRAELRLLEIARLLVRFNHVARLIAKRLSVCALQYFAHQAFGDGSGVVEAK